MVLRVCSRGLGLSVRAHALDKRKQRTTRHLQATAYHEAGHADAASCNFLKIRTATIIPGDEYGGKVQNGRMLKAARDFLEDAESISPRIKDRIEKQARARFAGIIAQR
jgi:hypothetical protein